MTRGNCASELAFLAAGFALPFVGFVYFVVQLESHGWEALPRCARQLEVREGRTFDRCRHRFADAAIDAYTQADQARENGQLAVQGTEDCEKENHPGDKERNQKGVDRMERWVAIPKVVQQNPVAGDQEPEESDCTENAERND